MKKTRLRKESKNPVAKCKKRIQALVRQYAINRDGTCILRDIRGCTDPVIQADHLVTRGNSATYADTRLIVALCRSCHGGWKKWNKEAYDALVRTLIGKTRAKLWEFAEADRHRHQTHFVLSDWLVQETHLKQLLAKQKV